MQRLRELKDEYKKLSREQNEANKQKQVVFSTKDSWQYHVAKLEAEVNLIKQK